jgi:hypothetical protein
MGLMNRFNNGAVYFGNARLVAGSVGVVKHDGYGLSVDPTGAGYGAGVLKTRWHVQFPAAQIRECEVLGVESRVTLTRLATLGLAGAGLRKNRTWIRISSRAPGTSEAVFEVRCDERQVQAWLGQIPWYRALGTFQPVVGAPPASAKSISEQLTELGALHQSGVLSDDEFRRAKDRLLSS